MAVPSRRIHISDDIDSELARLLHEADDGPVYIERGDAVYRLSRTDTLWEGYDPDRVLDALNNVAGSWSDVDAELMIAQLFAARASGSRN